MFFVCTANGELPSLILFGSPIPSTMHQRRQGLA
jgi:hypothetical protein